MINLEKTVFKNLFSSFRNLNKNSSFVVKKSSDFKKIYDCIFQNFRCCWWLWGDFPPPAGGCWVRNDRSIGLQWLDLIATSISSLVETPKSSYGVASAGGLYWATRKPGAEMRTCSWEGRLAFVQSNFNSSYVRTWWICRRCLPLPRSIDPSVSQQVQSSPHLFSCAAIFRSVELLIDRSTRLLVIVLRRNSTANRSSQRIRLGFAHSDRHSDRFPLPSLLARVTRLSARVLNRSIDLLIYRSTDLLIGRFIDRLIDPVIDRSIHRSTDWVIDLSIDLSID